MEVVLDTNALSAWADGEEDMRSVSKETTKAFIPAVVLGEYYFGLRGSRRGQLYRKWLETQWSLLEILNVTVDTAEIYSRVRHGLKTAGRPIPPNDIWIAASAIECGLPLLTRDRHFREVEGVEVLGF